MYIIGFTRSCPVLAPTVCKRSTGAPSNGPPTLPSLARNSSMILLFQSDISGILIFVGCAFGAHRPAVDPARPLPCHAPDVNRSLTGVHSRGGSNGRARGRLSRQAPGYP